MGLEPAKLRDFQLEEELGAGTSARVYQARHRGSQEPVAIKMLGSHDATEEVRERFGREALLLATLSSRHVGRLLSFGFEDGQPFLVLERLYGETLDAKLRRDGPLPLPLAMRWFEQLLIGVRDCHAAWIIHRDIKPSNVFLHRDADGESVRLIDFGVARLRDITGVTSELTSAHHVLGSMGYMAPEQFSDAKGVGFTADVYALGVVLFRMLTGRLPFVARSLETISRVKNEQSAPLLSSISGMPHRPQLDAHMARAMARDPDARFQTAHEMLEDWWRVMANLDDDTMPTDIRPHPLKSLPKFNDLGDDDDSMTLQSSDLVEGDDEETTRQVIEDVPVDSSRTPIAQVAPPSSMFHTPPPRREPPESDPFEVPTRTDPGLKQLVERELELHRQRRSVKT